MTSVMLIIVGSYLIWLAITDQVQGLMERIAGKG